MESLGIDPALNPKPQRDRHGQCRIVKAYLPMDPNWRSRAVVEWGEYRAGNGRWEAVHLFRVRRSKSEPMHYAVLFAIQNRELVHASILSRHNPAAGHNHR